MSVEPAHPIVPARKARRGPSTRLRNALDALAGGYGTIGRHSERAWASITFSGMRHTISISFTGSEAVEAGENFIAALPEHEFTLPGQLVGDATISSVEHTTLPQPHMIVECELLLLDDA